MKSLSKIQAAVLAAAFLTSASPAWAECSLGDVTAIFNNLPVFLRQLVGGFDTQKAGQVYGPIGGPCQYRLFFGPELGSEEAPPIQTFQAGQAFLGGAAYAWDYQSNGLTRQQAIADIELIENVVYLMETEDDWSFDVEELIQKENKQNLLVTAMRNARTYVDGELSQGVVQQQGIIMQLDAGRYVTLFISSYPGNPELAALHPNDPDWVERFEPYEYTSVVNLDIVE